MTARILVVEDNPANMELMGYLLQAGGYHVLFAHDGLEGIDVAEREHPALVICNINLPRLDGYSVLRHMRAHSVLKDIPCIAVTGDREKLIDAGFDGYISKPIDPETFVNSIEAYFAVRSKAADSRHDSPAP